MEPTKKEGEEEVVEETTEETPVQEEAEEKALLGKIKEVVAKTVDEKLEAKDKSVALQFDASRKNMSQKAIGLMSDAQSKAYNKLGDAKAKADYEDSIIIAKFIKAQRDGDRALIKDLSEGTDSEGGYLVPSPLSNRIFEIITAVGHARKEMTVLPMSSMTLDLSTLVTKPTVAVIAEGAQVTASDMVFGRKTLTATKVAGITAMSNEVLDDANIDLINYNIQKFGEAYADFEDLNFFNTSAAAGITGLLEDTTTEVDMATGATTDAFSDVTYDNLIDVVYAIGAKQRQGAKWCMSSYIVSLVMKLKDDNGMPVWSRPVDGEPARLLGYPIIENDQMPDAGDSDPETKFLLFGNFKKYIVGDRKSMTSTVLNEATVGSTNLAEKDSSGLRVVERISGIAPTPLEFVSLATGATS